MPEFVIVFIPERDYPTARTVASCLAHGRWAISESFPNGGTLAFDRGVQEFMLDADEDGMEIKACERFQVGSRNAGFRKRTCPGDESTNQRQVFSVLTKFFSWSPD